ncbi:hypothetical protein EV142_103322 [Flavobacterium circumlabens]|nr:hypothetical protein EV142_103322 [Flavobacterium circumlabens]
MDSLVVVLAELEKQGFTSQFEVHGNSMLSLKSANHYNADQLEVTHFYRFEGESNPEDSAIMYAIETYDKEKGTLVDGYGTAADTATSDFMRNVNNIHK